MPACRPHRPPAVRAARALAAVLAVLAVAGCADAPSRPAAGPTTTTPAPPAEQPQTVATVPGTLPPVEERATPVRLRVPSLDVDVDVVPVGTDAAGDMAVPGPEVAGWYRFGPEPGAPGSAVIAAHVDYDGRPGPFFRLQEVAEGDPVEVVMSDGAVLRLTVGAPSQVSKDRLADSGAFDRTGAARVTLVTCGGEFDRSRRSYEDNVVAVAEPGG